METGPPSQGSANDEPVLLSGSARASPLATAGYILVSVGHIWVLKVHAATAAADGNFFLALAVVEVALAYEAAVYALGGLGRSTTLSVLKLIGRLRLIGQAVAWPWLLPWAAELNCRSGAVSLTAGHMLLMQTTVVAFIISGFFIVVEVSFFFRGAPPAAAPSDSLGQMGECLPSEAILGGQFRLDKADLEETGRAVYVPGTPRQGLYIGAGLAMLGHLIMGVLQGHVALPPWLLLGALSGLFGRWFGGIPQVKGKRQEGVALDKLLLWRREGPRLVGRVGELVWMWLCVVELQRSEALPSWLPACSAP